jgi:hypothetical protein
MPLIASPYGGWHTADAYGCVAPSNLFEGDAMVFCKCFSQHPQTEFGDGTHIMWIIGVQNFEPLLLQKGLTSFLGEHRLSTPGRVIDRFFWNKS